MTHVDEQSQLGWRTMACLLLAGLADFLFYMEGMGWTAGIYTCIVLFALLLFNPGLTRTKPGKVIITINLALVVALIEDPTALAISLSFLGITSMALLSNPVWHQNACLWLKGIFSFWAQNIFRIFDDANLFKNLFQGEGNPDRNKINLKNLILPLGLSLVFVALFTGANPVMIRWFDWIRWDWIAELFAFYRILLWSLVIALCWPLLRPRFRLNQEPMREGDFQETKDLIKFLFSRESILYSLVLFNLLFAVQTSMDLVYLWGGSALPDGISYAEYAHRGAYPLIATALLAGAFVLVALRPGSETENLRPIRLLVYLWIGQNVFLVLSSICRTALYIEEYSLTYLRLAALIWMGLVALGLIWIALRILWGRSSLWLINANMASLLTVVMLCAFINMGGVVAQFNVEHSREARGRGHALDLKYLKEIGPASLPALIWLRQNAYKHSYTMAKVMQLENHLRQRLKQGMKDWRTWTFRNYRLTRMPGMRDELRASAAGGSSGWTVTPHPR